MSTPLGNRKNIVLVGKRNSGKSSIFNLLIGHEKSIVADYMGTTTDPVYQMMELLPYGPVKIVDTAGIDDDGIIGEKRVQKTRLEKEDADIIVRVIDGDNFTYDDMQSEEIPTLYVVNKCDKSFDRESILRYFNSLTGANNRLLIFTDLKKDRDKSREAIVESLVDLLTSLEVDRGLLEGLVNPKGKVLLVVPIDSQAPKGRLILPQVQVIRDCLDRGVMVSVVRDTELEVALNHYKDIDLVITDSQIFNKIGSMVDKDIRLTSFSILFARQKGDIEELVAGAKCIDRLEDGDKVLIAESCTHTSNHEDIGTVKIPNLIKKRTGKKIEFEFSHAKDFKSDLKKYKLVIQCGGCMLTRSNMMSRINKAKIEGVPITNYGVVLAYLTNNLDRVFY